jgi:hypothetical protein
MNLEPGSDLVLLHPDGKEEVLVAAGKGAVTDPCVSFDAQWVYYSYIPNLDAVSPVTHSPTPTAGADIYKISLASRKIVRLTHQEYTPNTSVRDSGLPYGIYNMGPCPIAGGKVVFTSNRNGFIPPKRYTPVTSQLFVMDDDGSNVQPIAPMTLGAALHPFQLKDGRIAFSTQEAQGLRDIVLRLWLDMHGDRVRARFGKAWYVVIGPLDHKMNVKRQSRQATNQFYDRGAKRNVVNKLPVHDVEV